MKYLHVASPVLIDTYLRVIVCRWHSFIYIKSSFDVVHFFLYLDLYF